MEGVLVSREASILSSAEADQSSGSSVKARPQQAEDRTFLPPAPLLNAPPLAPERIPSQAAEPELISGHQLVAPERIPAPTVDPPLRDEFLTRYRLPRAKDDSALHVLGTMGRQLKRRGALAVKDLKTQIRGALGSHLLIPSFRDSARRVSAPSAIGGSDHSRSGSGSPAQGSSLRSRPTHTRSASHSYAHDLLLRESDVIGCDCAVCDLVLRRCRALHDTSLRGSDLFDPTSASHPPPSRPISPATVLDTLPSHPATRDDSGTSSSALAKSDDTPEVESLNKPLPEVPSSPVTGSRRFRSSTGSIPSHIPPESTSGSALDAPRSETVAHSEVTAFAYREDVEMSPGHDRPSSDETTSSLSSSVDTPAQSMRRSGRRVPVPQASDSEPEREPDNVLNHKPSLSDVGDLVSGLDEFDVGANYVRLQMLGALNFQRRAQWCADPDNWSTVTLVVGNDLDDWCTPGMDNHEPEDARSARHSSSPSDSLSTIYDGHQWMLTPVTPGDDDGTSSRRRACDRKVRRPPTSSDMVAGTQGCQA